MPYYRRKKYTYKPRNSSIYKRRWRRRMIRRRPRRRYGNTFKQKSTT